MLRNAEQVICTNRRSKRSGASFSMNKILVTIGLVLFLNACVSSPQPTNVQGTGTPTSGPTIALSPAPLTNIQFSPFPTPDYEWTTRWLKGIPCRLPCWEGVTPGQTRKDEAVDILKRNPIIASVVITDSYDWRDDGYIIWHYTNVAQSWIKGSMVFNLRAVSSLIYDKNRLDLSA